MAIYEFNEPICIAKYEVTATSGFLNYAPKEWTLQGSNNNIDWIVLDEQIDQTTWSSSMKKSYTFSNAVKYKYYKLSITNTINGTIQGRFYLSEWDMYEYVFY
ncbi:hypothetical protein BSK59_33530, partial [Paenibacillus odorifer]